MIAVNIPQSTKFDEFDATDITEEDTDQFERRRARIGRPLIQGRRYYQAPTAINAFDLSAFFLGRVGQ